MEDSDAIVLWGSNARETHVPPRPAVGPPTPAERGRPAPFSAVEYEPPVDVCDDQYPTRLTTGRRLDSFNTGVQTRAYASPLRFGETLDLSPEDAAALGVVEGEVVRVSSRRGSVTTPVRLDPGLRPGLAFMTLHFPDQVETNLLTIEAWDPKSGTAEFKATAVRIDRLSEGDGDASVPVLAGAHEAP